MDKELLEKLSYSKCDCGIDYKELLGIINGVCPQHKGSILMVEGIPASAYMAYVKKKLTAKEGK